MLPFLKDCAIINKTVDTPLWFWNDAKYWKNVPMTKALDNVSYNYTCDIYFMSVCTGT